MRYSLPWGQPTGDPYDGDGPTEPCEVEHEGHRIRFTPTKLSGFNTGRPRVHVECLTCSEVLHEATTGPRPNAEWHWLEMRQRIRA